MKTILLSFFIFLFWVVVVWAQSSPGFLSVTEEDGAPDCYGWQIKAANDSITDNGDGTCSMSGGLVDGTIYGWQRVGTDVTLTNSGDNVGLGTVAPQAQLEVSSASTVGTGAALMVDNSFYGSKMVVLQNGNVGIGTSVPSNYFEVVIPSSVNTQNKGFNISRTGGTGYLIFGNGTADTDVLYQPTITGKAGGSDSFGIKFRGVAYDAAPVTAPLQFQITNTALNAAVASGYEAISFANYSTDLMVLYTNGDMSVDGQTFFIKDSTNNVGIGTTVPNAKVEVQSSGDTAFMISSTNTLDGDYLIVTSAGNVGIGSTVPRGKLEVNGSIYGADLSTSTAALCVYAGRIGHCSSTVGADGLCTCVP